MGFQPDATTDGLFLPSGASKISTGFYSPAGLTETEPDLYAFLVGDYAYPVYTPIPHVEMTVFALDPGTVTITAYRRAANRLMPVRGASNLPALGGVNIVDWDAPFGIPLSYFSEQFDIDGNSLGYTTESTTQVDETRTWVTNPLDPAGGVPVILEAGAAATLPRETDANYYYPQGRGVAFGVFGQRSGLKDVPVNFITTTDADADKVEIIFGDPYTSPSVPPVVCIRTGAGMNVRFPQPFYAGIDKPVPTPADLNIGGHTIVWAATAVEAAPPAPGLIVSVLTRDDLDTVYATRDAMDAAYATRLEEDSDYDLNGGTGTGPTPTPGDGTDIPTPTTPDYWGSGPYGSGIFGA